MWPVQLVKVKSELLVEPEPYHTEPIFHAILDLSDWEARPCEWLSWGSQLKRCPEIEGVRMPALRMLVAGERGQSLCTGWFLGLKAERVAGDSGGFEVLTPQG
eukprot:6054366-Amphidinium_carterae.1